jgi:hypothetical protein
LLADKLRFVAPLSRLKWIVVLSFHRFFSVLGEIDETVRTAKEAGAQDIVLLK